jgi:hypothetical protein
VPVVKRDNDDLSRVWREIRLLMLVDEHMQRIAELEFELEEERETSKLDRTTRRN